MPERPASVTLSNSAALALTATSGLEMLSRQKPNTVAATPSASTSSADTSSPRALETHLAIRPGQADAATDR